MQVQIRNFKSIEDISLSLKPGFTSFMGRSDVGKTSILQALYYFFTNKYSPSFVRDGESRIEVELHDGDTHILWERGPRDNRYVINGEEFSKLGRSGVPDKVREYKIGPINLSEKIKVEPQFNSQFNVLFLIQEKDMNALSDFLLEVSNSSGLYEAQNAVEHDKRDSSTVLKASEKKVEKIEDIFKHNKAFLQDLQDLYNKVKISSTHVSLLKSLYSYSYYEEQIKNIQDKIPKLDHSRRVLMLNDIILLRESYIEVSEQVQQGDDYKSLNIKKIILLAPLIANLRAMKASSEITFTASNIVDKVKILHHILTNRRLLTQYEAEISDISKSLSSITEELFKTGFCPVCNQIISKEEK